MKYRGVHEALFSDPKFIDASPDMRWIMVCLLISPHLNIIGCFRLPKAYFSNDTGYPIDRVSEGLRYHTETGFIRYCDRTGWVWIRRYLRYNKVAGPKQAVYANNLLAEVPKEACFFNELCEFFSTAYDGVELPKSYPIDTLSIPPARGSARDSDSDSDSESQDRSANADSSSTSDDGERAPSGGDDSPDPKLDPVPDKLLKPPTGPPPDLPEQAFAIWRDVIGDALKVPRKLEPDRRRRLKARLAERFGNDLAQWRRFCEQIRGSPHLTGNGPRGWVADFDWCLKPENLRKILEGNYDGPKSASAETAAVGDGKRGGAIGAHDIALAELRRRRSASG